MNNNCRICYEHLDIENNSELIYPCNCNVPVHKLCLTKWVKIRPPIQNYTNKNLTCEICNEIYSISFDENIINNYRYPSFRERQNILFYNRIYLFFILNCCNSCFQFFIFSALIGGFYYIKNKL